MILCLDHPKIVRSELNHLQWNPSKPPPLGPVKVSLLEGWPHFRGEFVLKSMLWDLWKWPEYEGGHISGVLIRGVPLYANIAGGEGPPYYSPSPHSGSK